MEVRLLSRKVGFSLANFCQVGFCSAKEMLEKWGGGGGEVRASSSTDVLF